MSKAAIMSTCVFCVDFMLLSPLNKYQGMRLWDHIVRIHSAFKEKSQVSSRVAVPLHIPPAVRVLAAKLPCSCVAAVRCRGLIPHTSV